MTSLPTVLLSLAIAAATFPLAAQSGLKINEVATASPDWVEITNLGATTADLTGVSLWAGWNATPTSFAQTQFVFPAGFTLAAGASVIVSDQNPPTAPSVPVGVFVFYAGINIGWTTAGPGSAGDGVATLTDATNAGIDRVVWGSPLQALAFGSPFAGTLSPDSSTLYRAGNVDTDSSADWGFTGSPSPGSLNPGQQSPIDLLTLAIASPTGMGDLIVSVGTFNPPAAGAEIFNLVSVIDVVPDGTGPFLGLATDAINAALTPLGAANPFHTTLDQNGAFALTVPPGGLPAGLHLECRTVLVVSNGIARISPVRSLTL